MLKKTLKFGQIGTIVRRALLRNQPLEEQITKEKYWRPWISIITAPCITWKSILSRNPYSDWRFWLNLVFIITVGAFACVFKPNKIHLNSNPWVAGIYI